MALSEMLERYRRDHQHPINKLTHFIGIPMIIVSLPWFIFDWKMGLVLFIVGWIFQFVGHLFEGKKPTFFSNPVFLIVGPLFFVKKLFKKKR
ncbi:DUF962 domain-containing protein [Hazenella sp. IB182357]|uniref:DUF962 domain-containing protein n=1 Tax=Polycladospora coralii TaxID=2771432 RepID=A0A926RUQ6_9BACL|nr:DUF962 domain-containing protein [Polycladospora coralii]MBD1373273.1 DUF962 domain-containing protein [Polycladospora coralii]